MKKIIVLILHSFLLNSLFIYGQNNFVSANYSSFLLNGKEFKFIGFNTYYLQSEAGDVNKRYIIDDVFQAAKNIGVNVIRTWAFYESSSFTNNSVIRKSPYEIQESGLIALDYVLYKAGEFNIFLILTLSNNYNAFGGIPQYLEWADSYLLNNENSFSHNDFFINDSLKQWFKFYIKTLLNRTNTFTGIKYKDDPSIFSFELMNEAENRQIHYTIIKDWYSEMAGYIRSIDQNHLITTGEVGYDIYENLYSDTDLFYNSSYFLLNGFKGTSFYENQSLENIDYISFHSYPEGWGLSEKAGKTWIKDHLKIAEQFNKPMLLGEFGIEENKLKVYKDWLEDIRRSESQSAVVWHYLHPDVFNNDGYGFNEYDSPELMDLFQKYIKEINSDTVLISQITAEAILHQNYPNPFNPVTTIKYSLPDDDFVTVTVHNSIGELVEVIDKGYKKKGEHELILSFNNNLLSSGIYFYSLRTSESFLTRKFLLMK